MILVAFFLNLGIGRKHLHTTRSEAITSIIQQRPLWIMQKGNRRLHSCISAATLYAGSCNVWLNAVSIPPSTSAPVFIARLNRREILTWKIPILRKMSQVIRSFGQFSFSLITCQCKVLDKFHVCVLNAVYIPPSLPLSLWPSLQSWVLCLQNCFCRVLSAS